MDLPRALQPEMTQCPTCAQPCAPFATFCPQCGVSLQSDEGVTSDPYLGRVIDGRFRVEALLGAGSMGLVYRATQLGLNKTVALKVLHQVFVSDPVVEERFRREALAASRLKHPNTLNIIHFGATEQGEPYIAMEFLEGVDLGVLVNAQFPLSTQRIVSMLSQVCLALDEAHEQGIVHRDLKPANIVVINRRGEEHVKVLDFGIAKIQDPGGDPDSAPLTSEGLVCGTPAFMSPEQVTGQPVDPRSDIFSLGIILYFMMTARLPFNGKNVADMASAILLDDPASPSRVRLDALIPPELEALCLRALAKEPAERIPSARTFSEALEAAYRRHVAEGGDERRDLRRARVVSQDSALIDPNTVTAAHVAYTPQRPHRSTQQQQRRSRAALALAGGLLLITATAVLWLALSSEETAPPPLPPETSGASTPPADPAPAPAPTDPDEQPATEQVVVLPERWPEPAVRALGRALLRPALHGALAPAGADVRQALARRQPSRPPDRPLDRVSAFMLQQAEDYYKAGNHAAAEKTVLQVLERRGDHRGARRLLRRIRRSMDD